MLKVQVEMGIFVAYKMSKLIAINLKNVNGVMRSPNARKIKLLVTSHRVTSTLISKK